MSIKLTSKVNLYLENNSALPLTLNGLGEEQWLLLFHKFIKDDLKVKKKHQVFVFETDDQAEAFYSLCKTQHPSLYYPDLGANIFHGVFASERALNERMLVLNKIFSSDTSYYVVTTQAALRLKSPTREFFKSKSLKLEVSDVVSPEELAQKLTDLGYSRAPTAEEPGTFSKKGEIFDVFPLSGSPVRIHYFDDMIEEVFQIDPSTMRTDRNSPLESFEAFPMPGSALTQENLVSFRGSLPRPALNFKEQRRNRDEMLERLEQGGFFPNYPLYFSLLFSETTCLLDELRDHSLFHFFNGQESLKSFELLWDDLTAVYDVSTNDAEFEDPLPRPEDLYVKDATLPAPSISVNSVHFSTDFEDEFKQSVDLRIENFKTFISHKNIVSSKTNRSEYIKALAKTVAVDIHAKNLWVLYRNESALGQMRNILEPFLKDAGKKANYFNFDLSEGFVYKSENLFFLSESDFYIHKVAKTKKAAKAGKDVFAEQLASLRPGDHVIHKEHGTGRYMGMEAIELGGQTGDFIALEYQGGDKVYVPVYKLDLLQKHSGAEASVKLANLKTKKFDQEKARASKSVKKLAFDLLELHAKRELKQGFAFSPTDDLYKEFENKFPFQETEDQLKAINDVLDDMTSSKPMDRLICGDVGFGKTEIAMRAAFKAVLDHKQVAVLVPTTVLAFQHFNTMLERFKDFPVNIDYVSRFKSPKQTTEVLERLREGKIDIIVGTHKLLSDKVKFNDLGLLVIDEEQRFGVGHKEKMKALKENIDCLTMTATPIPRTLQMSFLGIKDLSLIQTPPPKRQSIKTYLVKEDPATIKRAIEKELGRGGQIFVVHNKVHDMEDYTARIKKLAPQAKTVFAHGQMAEKELEKRITQFYERKFDLLVSTTIIESGIDIPSANTMIVDRADTYGLSQLHQLRGRIGRSDKKAYAYFVVPHGRPLSDIASKRLRALQTYAEMGAGFSLATSDLEIRGSGDILGPEQSGHIANIGLELYMDLLKDAIAEIKNEKRSDKKTVEIQTPFDALIPEDYISDTGLRLKYYKKLSNAPDLPALNAVIEELTDIYGLPPQKLNNLFVILESRIHFASALITNVKVQTKQISLNFNKTEVEQKPETRNKIIDFFMARPKLYKINPDFSVVCRFQDKITPEALLEFSKYIAQHMEPC